MALIKCEECAKEISDTAGKCPHCGAKVKKPVGRFGLALAILTGFVVIQCSMSMNKPSTPKAPTDPKVEARFQKTASIARLVKSSLRDPESMILESAWANEDASVVCIEYRARNGFGGMNKEMLVSAKGKASQKATDWNKHCLGQMYDMNNIEYALK